jgi:hypothetical protein
MNLMAYIRTAVDENYLLFQYPADLNCFDDGDLVVAKHSGRYSRIRPFMVQNLTLSEPAYE